MNIRYTMLGLAILVHCSTSPMQQNEANFGRVLKIAACYGLVSSALVTAGYLMYQKFKDPYTPFIQNTKKVSFFLRNAYCEQIKSLMDVLGVQKKDNYATVLSSLDEKKLDRCTTVLDQPFIMHSLQNGSFRREIIAALEKNLGTINQFKLKLAKSSSAEKYKTLQELAELHGTIQELLEIMIFFDKFSSVSVSYFTGTQSLESISNKYAEILKFENPSYNAEQLKAFVLKSALHNNWDYAYVRYAKSLLVDIQAVQEIKTRANKLYPTLYAKAGRIEEQLSAMLDLLLADPRYIEDCHQTQKEKQCAQAITALKNEMAAVKREKQKIRESIQAQNSLLANQVYYHYHYGVR